MVYEPQFIWSLADCNFLCDHAFWHVRFEINEYYIYIFQDFLSTLHQTERFEVQNSKHFLGRGSPAHLPRQTLPRSFSGFALDSPSNLERFTPSIRASPDSNPQLLKRGCALGNSHFYTSQDNLGPSKMYSQGPITTTYSYSTSTWNLSRGYLFDIIWKPWIGILPCEVLA